MNAITEFFTTLFTHRAIIRGLHADVQDRNKKIIVHEQATEKLAHALVYITTPAPEPVEVPLKPIRLQRRSYSEEAFHFERTNSARFRDIDRERAKKAAQVNR
jgi:hypothetical protein